eukprot:5334298-Amphidinium_carterae.2
MTIISIILIITVLSYGKVTNSTLLSVQTSRAVQVRCNMDDRDILSVCRSLGGTYRIRRPCTVLFDPFNRAPLPDISTGSSGTGTCRRDEPNIEAAITSCVVGDSSHVLTDDTNDLVLQESSLPQRHVGQVRAERSRSRSPRGAIVEIVVDSSSTSSSTSTSDETNSSTSSSSSSSTSTTSSDCLPLTHLLVEKKHLWEDLFLMLGSDATSTFLPLPFFLGDLGCCCPRQEGYQCQLETTGLLEKHCHAFVEFSIGLASIAWINAGTNMEGYSLLAMISPTKSY